jgi:hypothetical protein
VQLDQTKTRKHMPLINLKFIEVAFTPKLKQKIGGANPRVCRDARPGIARVGNDGRVAQINRSAPVPGAAASAGTKRF